RRSGSCVLCRTGRRCATSAPRCGVWLTEDLRTLQLPSVALHDARRAKIVSVQRYKAAVCKTLTAGRRGEIGVVGGLSGILLALIANMKFSLAFHCCLHESDAQRSMRISAVPRQHRR